MEHFQMLLNGLNCGKARPSLIENIVVNCYGSACPLKEIALVSMNKNGLMVQPFDQSILKDIEKALTQSNISVSVQLFDKGLHITVPQISMERQQSYIKQAKLWAEQEKIAIRNLRRSEIKTSPDVSIDKLTKHAENEINVLLGSKVDELSLKG